MAEVGAAGVATGDGRLMEGRVGLARSSITAAAVVLALVAGACGGGGEEAAEEETATAQTAEKTTEEATEEATEDIYNLAGLSEEDRVFSPAPTSIRKRLPWMLINLLTCFLAAWVVGLFERSIQQMVALAVFLPVVGGMAGNGGTQSLTVITRGIALGELEFSSGFRALRKELAVGLAIGAITGLVSAGIALAWQAEPVVGLALFLAMVVSMTVSGMMGAAVPLILKSLRLDPALGSGVIVTTFTDVFAFFAFLGIATLLLDRIASG